MNTAASLLAIALLVCAATAFAPMGITTKRSELYMRRGRGSGLKRELDDSSSSSSFTGGMGGGSAAPAGGTNWLNTNKSIKELPEEEGKVKMIETGAFLLVDKGTNPNGAAATVKYEGEVYCFEASCPQCKIPMLKAKVLPANDETGNKAPRISCDLCKSTYNLKTGEKLEAAESTGFLGGIAKAVLGANEGGNMDTYKLGEKNGKIMFNMEGMQ